MKAKLFAFAFALVVVSVTSLAYAFAETSKGRDRGNWYGYQVLDTAENVQMHVLFFDIADKIVCEAINDTYYKGILLDCPKCKVITSGCATGVPAYFSTMKKKMKWILPYVYFGEALDARAWFLGLDRNTATTACRLLAKTYNDKGFPAACVE